MKFLDSNIILDSSHEVPDWDFSYLTFTSEENNPQVQKVKNFYKKIFRKNFIEFKPIDIGDNYRYVNYLLSEIRSMKKDNLITAKDYRDYLFLFNDFYPEVFNYIDQDLIALMIDSSMFKSLYSFVCEYEFTLERYFNELFLIEINTGLKTINTETIFQIISKNPLTKLGRNNLSKIIEIFEMKLDDELNKHSSNNNQDLLFWDLFVNRKTNSPYEEKYYRKFFPNESQYRKSIRLDRVVYAKSLEDWNLEDGISTYFNNGKLIPPLKYNILQVSIVNFLKVMIVESENYFRQQNGFPLLGEEKFRWKSENELFMLIQAYFEDEKIEQQASPNWLGRQHFDIYFPEWNIAVEYQGMQHYKPIKYFGGEKAFIKNLERDKRKKEMAITNSCDLIYVNKGYDIKAVLQEIKKLIKGKQKSQNLKYTTKKVSEVKSDSKVISLENVEIYDCKHKKNIGWKELKKRHPKAQYQNLFDRDALYKRYVLKSKLESSKIPNSWKTIIDLKSMQTYRFNRVEFAKFVGVNSNNVWYFFEGKHKQWSGRYEILEE